MPLVFPDLNLAVREAIDRIQKPRAILSKNIGLSLWLAIAIGLAALPLPRYLAHQAGWRLRQGTFAQGGVGSKIHNSQARFFQNCTLPKCKLHI